MEKIIQRLRLLFVNPIGFFDLVRPESALCYMLTLFLLISANVLSIYFIAYNSPSSQLGDRLPSVLELILVPLFALLTAALIQGCFVLVVAIVHLAAMLLGARNGFHQTLKAAAVASSMFWLFLLLMGAGYFAFILRPLVLVIGIYCIAIFDMGMQRLQGLSRVKSFIVALVKLALIVLLLNWLTSITFVA